MVTGPDPLGIHRDHERVHAFQVQQHPFRPGTAGQQISQLAVDPVKQAGAQQQVLDTVRLAAQHLAEQVLRDRAVAAGEEGGEAISAEPAPSARPRT
jgi:DnaJ-domain-containing protein 1